MLRSIPMTLVGRASLASLLAAACMIDNPQFELLAEFGSGVEATGSGSGSEPSASTTGSETGAGSTAGSGTATSDVSTSDMATSGMSTSNVSGSDGSSTGGACVPMAPCFTGSPDTMNVGECHGGQSVCTPEGELAACEGEVAPKLDPCDTPEDEDCNGSLEDCAECIPGMNEPCYNGPEGTEGLGICVGGKKLCTDMGKFGPCMGEVKPIPEEICGNMFDDDCDAQLNEGC